MERRLRSLIRKIDPQVDVNDVMARVREATLAAARDGVADPNGWRQMASATPALQELLATFGKALAEAGPKAGSTHPQEDK